jgi:hypothetical protein
MWFQDLRSHRDSQNSHEVDYISIMLRSSGCTGLLPSKPESVPDRNQRRRNVKLVVTKPSHSYTRSTGSTGMSGASVANIDRCRRESSVVEALKLAERDKRWVSLVVVPLSQHRSVRLRAPLKT